MSRIKRAFLFIGCICVAVDAFPFLVSAILNLWEYFVGVVSGTGQDTFYRTALSEGHENNFPYFLMTGVAFIVYGLYPLKRTIRDN